jgi:hypothetical protein
LHSCFDEIDGLNDTGCGHATKAPKEKGAEFVFGHETHPKDKKQRKKRKNGK